MDSPTAPATGTLSPSQWPRMSGDLVWQGSQYESDCAYTLQLGLKEVLEVERAVADFKDLELDGPDITKDNFALPTLGGTLLSAARELHTGRGFFVVRGLDPKRYSPEDNLMIFLGISAYIGEDRAKQDNRGNMLVHLHHDIKRYPVNGEGPSRHSNKASPFHTDMYSDILALHVRNTAARGGVVKLASSWNVYNKLSATRPDLVEELARPDWLFESRGWLFPKVSRSLLFFHAGRIVLDFSRRPLLGTESRQLDTVSRLSQGQSQALKELDRLAREDQLLLDTKSGDMIFINNHAILHSRDDFRDEGLQRRHLVRMWLRNTEHAWPLPESLGWGNRRIFYENELRERWAVSIASPATMSSSFCPYDTTSH